MRRIAWAAAGLLLVYGAVRMKMVDCQRRSAPAFRAGIVQPNVSIEDKGDPSLGMKNLWLLQSLSGNLDQWGAELILWPESAYPFHVPRDRKTDFEGARRIAAHVRVPLIAGALSYGGGRYYNSAYLVTPDGGLVGPSDKNNLVLFGEHNPLKDLVPDFLRKKFPSSGRDGLVPGEDIALLSYGKMRAGILNCYEDILSGYTARVSRRGANILINITNDAWFGDTSEPWEHLALAVFRTVENRRDLLRAVNTGVSAAIDAAGRIGYRTGVYRQEFGIVEARLMEGTTPYQLTGNATGVACAVACLLILALAAVRRRRGRNKS